MSLDNKTIVHRLYEEVWNKRKLEVMDQLISPSHALQDAVVSGSRVGPEFYKRRVVEFMTGFPDLSLTIEDTIAERDKIVVSWIISGTHQGDSRHGQENISGGDHHSPHPKWKDS